ARVDDLARAVDGAVGRRVDLYRRHDDHDPGAGPGEVGLVNGIHRFGGGEARAAAAGLTGTGAGARAAVAAHLVKAGRAASAAEVAAAPAAARPGVVAALPRAHRVHRSQRARV